MATDGWRELRVSELAEIVGGATPSTADASNFGGDIPWLTPRDLSNYRGRFVSHGERNLSRKGVEAAGLRLLPKGTVLLSTRAPVGYVAIAQNPLTTNQGFRNLVVKPEFIPEFVYYLLRQDTERLKAFASGTTFGELSGSTLGQLRFRVPPHPEQRAIASILGALDDDIHARLGDSEGLKRLFKHLMKRLLSGEWSTDRAKEWLRTTRPAVQAYDDKIELNRRMNQTLEEIARALFKFWFVDFGPVRAKAEGRWKKGESLPGMPDDMWVLWPSEFEESEIGEIPKGWEVAGLGEVADCPRELVDPREIDAEERYVGLEHIAPRSLSLWQWGRAGDTISGKARFKRGDLLFGKLRPYFHKVCVPSFDGVASTDILTITPKSAEWFGFALGHFNSVELVEHATATSNGTKMPRTKWEDLARWPIAIPPLEIARAFSSSAMPLTSKIHSAIEESRVLSAIRDTLLPKLLSGEIRVPLNGGK